MLRNAKSRLIAQVWLGALLAAFLASPATATIPLNGHLNASAAASVGDHSAYDRQVRSWNQIPATLSTDVRARATFGPEQAIVTGQATATWNSADKGSVVFNNYGWQFQIQNQSANANLTHRLETDDWSYTFIATADGAFTLDWSVALITHAGAGLRGWTLSWSGADGSGFPQPSYSDPTEAGVFTASVHAGQRYTIALQPAMDQITLIGHGSPQAYASLMNGRFDWSIASVSTPPPLPPGGVPEPATWALLALGFATLGFNGLRRRLTA